VTSVGVVGLGLIGAALIGAVYGRDLPVARLVAHRGEAIFPTGH
jgi:hypothetical protein